MRSIGIIFKMNVRIFDKKVKYLLIFNYNINFEIYKIVVGKLSLMDVKLMDMVLKPKFQERIDFNHELIGMGVFPLTQFGNLVGKPPTCFIKGTKIVMADGDEKPVENIIPATCDDPTEGDVIISVDGVKTYVVGMLAGPRPEPCVQIRAKCVTPEFRDEEFEVTVSMGHTISVDLSRMVHAWFLREGDYVCTIYGQAIIDKMALVDYEEEVFNIYLASSYFIKNVLPNLTQKRLYYHLANSSLGLTPKQHLIFGNGILSGDLYVQIQSAEVARLGYSLTSFI